MKTFEKPRLPFKVDFAKLSKALFVLSQIALKRKVEIYELQQEIDASEYNDRPKKIRKVKQMRMQQQYFHLKRMNLLRYLMTEKVIKSYGYVAIKDNLYANVRIVTYDFYVIINKKMISALNLKNIGNELKFTKELPMEEVTAIMDPKMAYSYFSQVVKMAEDAKAEEIAAKAKEFEEQKKAVLAKTVSSTGSVVVIKRKK